MLFGLLFVLSLSFAFFMPPSPTQSAVAGPVSFEGRYYNNMTLSGIPVLVRTDRIINFSWGTDSPAGWINADQFSVRWVRTAFFQEGVYKFTVAADDGVRLFIDERLVINQWQDQSVRSYTSILPLSHSVAHTVTLEYYENRGHATAILNWEQISTSDGFIGAYYQNRTLSGVPTQMRVDPTINFAWGSGSPFPSTIAPDKFSARWTMKPSLSCRWTVPVYRHC
jgi:hypothetical protein